MENKYVDYICSLHGYLIRVKEIHWNTGSNATHLLCDEIEDDIHDCEDRIAECLMGMSGKRFRIGDLKPLLPNSDSLVPMLKELEKETLELKKGFTEKDCGLENICDDIIECCNKYKYRATQN